MKERIAARKLAKIMHRKYFPFSFFLFSFFFFLFRFPSHNAVSSVLTALYLRRYRDRLQQFLTVTHLHLCICACACTVQSTDTCTDPVLVLVHTVHDTVQGYGCTCTCTYRTLHKIACYRASLIHVQISMPKEGQ